MHTVSKIMKVLLALTLAVGALWGMDAMAGPKAKDKAPAPEVKAPQARVIEMSVTERGYEPSPINVKKGEPLKLLVTRKTEQTCATELQLPDYNIDQKLPLNKTVEITFTPDKSGQFKYGCAMGMMISGVIQVE
jgi:plastocyanin domain-containing protein